MDWGCTERATLSTQARIEGVTRCWKADMDIKRKMVSHETVEERKMSCGGIRGNTGRRNTNYINHWVRQDEDGKER